MVQGTTGAAVVVNVVGAEGVAAGYFVSINAVQTLSGGVGGIPVIMDVAIEDLVVVGPNGDSTFGAVFDFDAVNDVVAAVDVDTDVAIGGVLSIDNRAAGNFRLEGNWTGGGSAFAKMNSPTAIVVGVVSGFHNNDRAGGGATIRADNLSQWLG